MSRETKDNYCSPFNCDGFFPNGAIFCHICGKPYSQESLDKENNRDKSQDLLIE